MTARLICGLIAALSLVITPLMAGAHSAEKIARIGYLGTNIGAASLPPIEAFGDGLRRLGWIEGQNIIVEYRWGRGENDEVVAAHAAELAGLKLDLIVAAASTYARPLQRATNTIPIVFCSANDPVGDGHVASLARPGGNMTGLSNLQNELAAKSLELLTEAVPGARRIGLLWDPNFQSHVRARAAIEAAARSLGVELLLVPASTASEFDAAFAAMSDDRAEAMLALATSVAYSNRVRLAELALAHRLPNLLPFRDSVEAGGLLSYGPDLNAMFRHCATFVDKILKGAKAADLPVEQAPTYELVVNLKTARALGLTIPPAFLDRTNEVIE